MPEEVFEPVPVLDLPRVWTIDFNLHRPAICDWNDGEGPFILCFRSESDARFWRLKNSPNKPASIQQYETEALMRIAAEVGIAGIAVRSVDGDWKTWHTSLNPPQGCKSA